MRLLVVNPNTSEGVTARIRAAALAVAEPGDQITTLSAASGPELILNDADGERATLGVIDAIKRHPDPIDGIVLASFGDTGAAEVRALYPGIPVLGIAEAVCVQVKSTGTAFSIVTFAPEVVPSLWQMADKHGVRDLLLEVSAVPIPLKHSPGDVADALKDSILKLCLEAVANGAHSLVLGGGPLAGLSQRIQVDCPVPLLDGTQAAINQLRSLHGQTKKSR